MPNAPFELVDTSQKQVLEVLELRGCTDAFVGIAAIARPTAVVTHDSCNCADQWCCAAHRAQEGCPLPAEAAPQGWP